MPSESRYWKLMMLKCSSSITLCFSSNKYLFPFLLPNCNQLGGWINDSWVFLVNKYVLYGIHLRNRTLYFGKQSPTIVCSNSSQNMGERESCTVASMEKEGKNWIFTTMFWPITTPLGAFPLYQASNKSIWNIYLFYNAYIYLSTK